MSRPKWVVLIPVSHVELTDATDHEFRVDRVTLVSTKKLPYRRKRLGLPKRLSDLPKAFLVQEYLAAAPVTAIVRMHGVRQVVEAQVVSLVRDELAILAASQLGYAKRHQTAAPAPVGERAPSRRSQLWVGSDGAWTQPNTWFGPMKTLNINDNWLTFQRKVFFLKLLKLLRGATTPSWRKDLRRAAVLIGLSQTAHSLADAFLWNMIALELLMTTQGDAVNDALPSRAEALLGWSEEWSNENFPTKIRDAYQQRCRIVHQGDRDCPTREDLFFTDDLLVCLLSNLASHPQRFRSKDDVIQFSRQVEAERLLKVKPKVRPKSLVMLRREYRLTDYGIY